MRTEAQKRADKKYHESHKGSYVKWSIHLKPAEADRFNEVIKASGYSKPDFIRLSIKSYLQNKFENIDKNA